MATGLRARGVSPRSRSATAATPGMKPPIGMDGIGQAATNATRRSPIGSPPPGVPDLGFPAISASFLAIQAPMNGPTRTCASPAGLSPCPAPPPFPAMSSRSSTARSMGTSGWSSPPEGPSPHTETPLLKDWFWRMTGASALPQAPMEKVRQTRPPWSGVRSRCDWRSKKKAACLKGIEFPETGGLAVLRLLVRSNCFLTPSEGLLFPAPGFSTRRTHFSRCRPQHFI